ADVDQSTAFDAALQAEQRALPCAWSCSEVVPSRLHGRRSGDDAGRHAVIGVKPKGALPAAHTADEDDAVAVREANVWWGGQMRIEDGGSIAEAEPRSRALGPHIGSPTLDGDGLAFPA